MSAEWIKYKLGDLTDWYSGGTPSKAEKEFWDGDIPWISASSMYCSRFSTSELKITTSGLKAGSRLADTNTILLLVRGSMLHQRIPVGITEAPVSFNQDVKAICIKPEILEADIIDPWFLLYWIKSQEKMLLSIVENTGIGAGKLDTKQLQNLIVNVPPVKLRNRITWIAKNIEDKEILNAKTNQTLEKIAQAIFKSWFVDFDPVKAKITALEVSGKQEAAELATMSAISGKNEAQLAQLKIQNADAYQQLAQTAALFPAAMQESELGEIPEGWTTLPLYETAEYINGASFKVEDFSGDRSGLPIVKIAELKQGISEGTKFTTGNFNKRIFIKTDDVLYSWSGSPETSLEVFKWFGGDGWLNQHIFKLNFSSDEQKYFTYYLLKHLKPVLIETAKQKQTTGLGHITVADMKRIKITTPNKAVFLAFGKKVKSLYAQCSLLDKENIALSNIRDSLIPKLLSGEITFSDMEPM